MALRSAERAANLRDFVREELKQVKDGTLDRISTEKELMDRFGYSASGSIQITLRRVGLIKERTALRKMLAIQDQMKFNPSRELAWMLGVLAAGGYVDTKEHREITLYSGDVNLLARFKSIGEVLLETSNPQEKLVNRRDGTSYHLVRFHKKSAAKALGDLRGDHWPGTIVEKHHWIREDVGYSWGLLEGVFNISGIITTGRRHEIKIATTKLATAHFLQDLMKFVGIERPLLDPALKRREKIQGVKISNWKDIKLFVTNVQSDIASKEQLLDFLREYEPRVCSYDTLREYEDLLLRGQIMSFEEFMNMKEKHKNEVS